MCTATAIIRWRSIVLYNLPAPSEHSQMTCIYSASSDLGDQVSPGLSVPTCKFLYRNGHSGELYHSDGTNDLYYIAFPRDHRGLKCIVAAIFFLETTQTILLAHDAFRVYASGWGNPAELDSIGLYWLNIPILSGFISALTQLFYAWRIYILSRSYYASGTISVVAIVQGIIEIYDGFLCLQANRLSRLPQTEAYRVFIVWLAMGYVSDVMITSSMFYYLHCAKKTN